MSSMHHPGPARRPTVVLFHSSAASARQWTSLIELLQPRFRVHAVELFGHGAQPDWHDAVPLTLAHEAALAAPLLAFTGGVHVVGHSYGGAVALKLATLYPHAVRSVVGYEPMLFRRLLDDDPRSPPALGFIAVGEFIRDQLELGRPYAAAGCFVDFWSGPGTWDSMPEGIRDAIAARMPAVHRQFGALTREPPRDERLAGLSMPMLLMSGARSVAVTRRIAELLREGLPHARHEALPKMGHMGPITHAAEVNRRIAAFLHERTFSDTAALREAA